MFPPPRRADTRPFHRHRAASHSISQNGRSHLEPVTFHPVSKRGTSVNLSATVALEGVERVQKKKKQVPELVHIHFETRYLPLGTFYLMNFCLIRSLNYFHFLLPKTPAWISFTGVQKLRDLKHMCTNIPLRLEVDHRLATPHPPPPPKIQ